MLKRELIEEMLTRLGDVLPLSPVKGELRDNLRQILESSLNKLELVTREEFDAQVKVLTRSREKLDALEVHLAVPESNESGNSTSD